MIGLSLPSDYQIMANDRDPLARMMGEIRDAIDTSPDARAQYERVRSRLFGARAPEEKTMTTTAYALLTVPLHQGIVPERHEVFVSPDRGEWQIADPSSWCQEARTRVADLAAWNPRLGSDPGELVFRPRNRRGRADTDRTPREGDLRLGDLCPELANTWREEIARIAAEQATRDAEWRATSAERARRNDDLQRRLGDAGHEEAVISRRFRD